MNSYENGCQYGQQRGSYFSCDFIWKIYALISFFFLSLFYAPSDFNRLNERRHQNNHQQPNPNTNHAERVRRPPNVSNGNTGGGMNASNMSDMMGACSMMGGG